MDGETKWIIFSFTVVILLVLSAVIITNLFEDRDQLKEKLSNLEDSLTYRELDINYESLKSCVIADEKAYYREIDEAEYYAEMYEGLLNE